jgi:hypothetical protein
MSDRPDLAPLRKKLVTLVVVIVVAVVGLLALTFYLYQRFTAGVHVTPE